MIRKREGFKGQKAIVLPHYIQQEALSNPLTKLLYITDIGYYPAALYHYRERPSGCDQNILIFCINGEGWVEADRSKKVIKKNQFVIIPAQKPHKYGSDDIDPWTIYWTHFKGEISSIFVPSQFKVIDLNPDENTRNSNRIRLFEETYHTLTMGFSKENLEYSSVCLWYLLGSFKYITNFERIGSFVKNDIIEKSITYMNDNIFNRITLDQLAKNAGLSVSQFSLVFKKKTSRSPIDYYINLKIQNACQLLDFTGMNIKEVASQLDFDDQFYFSRLFKKIMGMSPMEYKKRKKG